MSSPSSARISASSSRIARNTKRDVAASRSKVIGASSISNSSRIVAGTGSSGSGRSARVFLDGADVTPQSLLVSRIKPSTAAQQRGGKVRGKGAGRSKGSNAPVAGQSVMGASVIFSSASVASETDSDGESSATLITTAKSQTKPSQPKPSVTSAPQPASNQDDDEGTQDGDATPSDVGKGAGFDDETGGSGATSAMTGAGVQGADGAAMALDRGRRRPLTVLLEETPTIMLFELRSVCVALDAPNHQAVVARNKRYVELCAGKKGSDRYVEGRSQTLQLAQKAKEVMTAPPATRDAAVTATDWDIFDCARLEEESSNQQEDQGGDGPGGADATTAASASHQQRQGGQHSASSRAVGEGGEFGDAQLQRQVDEIVGATLASPGCVLDVDGDIIEDLRARQHHSSRTRKARAGVGHGGASSSSSGNKSRVMVSTAHVDRSTANVNGSSASAVSPNQSGTNLSFGASQDVTPGDGASSGSAVAPQSQVGVNSASHGVLSGGTSDTSDGKQPNAYARANANVDLGDIIGRQRTAKVLGSASLLRTANILERAVQQNVYHQQHVRYRDFPTLESSVEGAIMDGSAELSGPTRSPGLLEISTVPAVPPVPAFASGFPSAGTGAKFSPTKAGPALERLWAFRCELAADRVVSCLAWNTINDDLLAVSYARTSLRSAESASGPPTVNSNGPVETTNPPGGAAPPGSGSTSACDDGLVLFWSLKNPEFPERIYHFPVGVTSIDFSRTHPYLLAVGFADGVVAIYDTRRDDLAPAGGPSGSSHSGPRPPPAPTASSLPASSAPSSGTQAPIPIASSELSNGKHLEAVWQIRWISKGVDRAENVVSISSDGRVTEWSLKKGLSFSDLMTLKRVTNPLLGSDARADGVISRQASGQCIDFARHDPSVYFVGTEDGMIHKCSISYNEQYLQTFIGHTGPVYQLLVSPFCNDLLLSCSGDWTVKLWHQSEGSEVLTFRSVDLAHAVLGISWSPSDAAVFATVTEDGRIEIWNLAESILDPVVTHFPKKFVTVVAPSTTTPASASGRKDSTRNEDGDAGDLLTTAGGASNGLDDDPNTATNRAAGLPAVTRQEVPLECTTVAFAPVAPVLVVGDSTGDVTVYRMPAQMSSGRWQDKAGADVQVARLLRAISSNNPQ